MIPINYYLALAAILFTMGAMGVLLRRNSLVIFMSIELMLNAANLTFVAFARMYSTINPASSTINPASVYNGQIFVFFVMTVAAAEVAVGLALIVAIFRSKQSIDVDQMNILKG